MEQTLETDAAELLDGVTAIIKCYEEQWQKTGGRYNIFKVADIAKDERKVCRVIADLLNPKGSHYQGDVYLQLFWDIVSPRMQKNCVNISLDTAKANVIREDTTDAGRHPDIAIDDGKVYIPVEVKIGAGERNDQIKDYAKHALEKNKKRQWKTVPVLFLTPDGKESETAQEYKYVTLSFEKDIISWLEQCIEKTEIKALPVREVIKQLLSAINSFCGKSGDKKIDKKIVKLITKSEESIRAALAIKGVLDSPIIDDESWELFKGIILEKVKERCDADYYDDEYGSTEGNLCFPVKRQLRPLR